MAWMRVAVAALVAVSALAAVAAPAPAHEEKIAHITLVHPWSRPAAQGHNGVIYLDILNRGAVEDRLVAVSTPLAAKAELHRSTMTDGIHRMKKVENIAVPAGGKAELAPGGLHVMLIGLTFMLMAEETIPVTFTCERAGAITATVTVEERGGDDGHSGMSGHGDDH